MIYVGAYERTGFQNAHWKSNPTNLLIEIEIQVTKRKCFFPNNLNYFLVSLDLDMDECPLTVIKT